MTTVNFDGRTAIVTGAGHGMGRAFALALAERGADVVVNDIGTTDDGRRTAEATIDEIRHRGGSAVADLHSISDPQGAHDLVAGALAAFGRVDVLINNAGIVAGAPFADHGLDDMRRLLEVHVMGTYLVTQHAYRAMVDQEYGRIVSISSNAGVMGMPNMAGYGAAKAALMGLTNVVALEGEPHGVLANAVLPMASTHERSRSGASQQIAATLGGLHARMTPEFVTPLVVFLASEACTRTQSAYSAVCGRYAQVRTAVTEGWFCTDDEPPTPDEIGRRLETIEESSSLSFPRSLDAEIRLVVAAVSA